MLRKRSGVEGGRKVWWKRGRGDMERNSRRSERNKGRVERGDGYQKGRGIVWGWDKGSGMGYG